MSKFILLFVVLLAAVQLHAQKSAIFVESGKAIRGYDAVTYFKEDKPVQGNNHFVYHWNGADWYFSSKENLNAFQAAPEKFAPQYGGYCAYGLSQGHKAPTEPDAWTIVNGKLYLNYNTKVRELWNKNREERITTADKIWLVIKEKE
ncbi:MAG: YHS domain-containing protein [Flavisolibacter sp.]|nr:YHS domain-containing protein [Flavisolibacter sp.]